MVGETLALEGTGMLVALSLRLGVALGDMGLPLRLDVALFDTRLPLRLPLIVREALWLALLAGEALRLWLVVGAALRLLLVVREALRLWLVVGEALRLPEREKETAEALRLAEPESDTAEPLRLAVNDALTDSDAEVLAVLDGSTGDWLTVELGDSDAGLGLTDGVSVPEAAGDGLTLGDPPAMEYTYVAPL